MTHTGFAETIRGYDFHIYYNDLHERSHREAIDLKNKIFDDFQDLLDEDKLILKVLRTELKRGPHYIPFFEVDVEDPAAFAEFFSWIQYNHGTLSVLVHPNSGDSEKDHTDHAGWIGDKLPINTDVLKGYGYPEFGFPSRKLIEEGFYKDPKNYEGKSIMVRLLEVGDRDQFWS